MAAANATLIERKAGRIGITRRASAASWTDCGTPAVTAEQEDVVRAIGVIEVGRAGAGGEHDEAAAVSAAPFLERRPVCVPRQRDLIEVVHAGAAKGTVGSREARRLDDMRLGAEAGAQPQHGAGVLRDVRFVEGKAHGMFDSEGWGTGGAAALPLPVGERAGVRGLLTYR